MDDSEDPNAGGKRVSLITMINKSNKNYPVGEKQTGQGWTQTTSNIW